MSLYFFFFQAEDGIRDHAKSPSSRSPRIWKRPQRSRTETLQAPDCGGLASAYRQSRLAAILRGPGTGAAAPRFQILRQPGGDAAKSRNTSADRRSQMVRETGGYAA